MIDLIKGDITRLKVDAIVDAANRELMGGGGVSGAIHAAAGPELRVASMAKAPCETGSAVITPGFKLPARYVIHAVGPIWHDGRSGEPEKLRSAYERCFALALEQGIRSIAFPAISTGIYGYPREDAAAIAVDVMRRHEHAFDCVVACVFDEETYAIYARLLT